MKKIVLPPFAALLLCALLLTACGGDIQKDVPSGDPPEETRAPAVTPKADDGLPAEQAEDVFGPAPEDRDSPDTPPETDTPTTEPDTPTTEPDTPTTEPDAPDAEPDAPDAEPDAPDAEPDVPDAEPDVPDAEPDVPDAEPDVPAVGPAAPVAEASSSRLGETGDAGREYLDKLIFLGDSTTYGIGYYYEHGFSADLVPPGQVWTPASGTLTLSYYATATIVYPETGEELFIRDAVERAKPEYLVITLGVNGISFMDEEWFIRDYTGLVELVKAASPETKIILNSIYPVCASYPHRKDINNDKIRAANGWIEQIAVNTGVRFLYSYESVVGADGNLPESSSNGDGLHLTGEAFTRVMAYIRTHAYR